MNQQHYSGLTAHCSNVSFSIYEGYVAVGKPVFARFYFKPLLLILVAVCQVSFTCAVFLPCSPTTLSACSLKSVMSKGEDTLPIMNWL